MYMYYLSSHTQSLSLFLLTLAVALQVNLASPASSSSSSSSSSAASVLLKNLAPVALQSVMGRNYKQHPVRVPMRPIEPSAAGPVDYITPLINLMSNVREMEHNLKKRTYSYGLMVVGRPLEELTIPQRMLRAALMPSKYYEEVTSSMAKAINNIVINKQPNSNRRQSKSKYRPVTAKNHVDWTDVLVRLISLAASSLPTPVVKS